MSTTQLRTEDDRLTAEEVVERHEEILEEWAEEDTLRGAAARAALRVGRGDDE